MSQVFRRAVFNVLSVNRDDHAKNFSYLLPESGSWQFAPASEGAPWTQTHQMCVGGNFLNITLDNFRLIGDRLDIPDIERTLAEISSSIAQWRDFATTVSIDEVTTMRIASDLEDLRVN